MSTGFLTPEDFYALLADGIDDHSKNVLATMRHTRIEAAYRNRKFIVYQMNGREAEKLATVAVLDFLCDDETGCSTQIEWLERPGDIITVGYEPVQLWDFPIFVHLPVNQKVRWSAKDGDPNDRSLSFLMVIRTQTRRHLRERDATYMETYRSFQEEFFAKSDA
jgi:hypothetical protein